MKLLGIFQPCEIVVLLMHEERWMNFNKILYSIYLKPDYILNW